MFTATDPYDSGTLDAGDGHQAYWEVRANPAGRPAVVLDGGPASGLYAGPRRYLDPIAHRVVLFDQRGSGAEPAANQ